MPPDLTAYTHDDIPAQETAKTIKQVMANSTRVFTRPTQDFYVLLEVGPGHTAQVDHTAIKPARAAGGASTANQAAAR